MTDMDFTKIFSVSVALLFLIGAAIPIVTAMAITTETVTTENTYGTNSLDAYIDTVASSEYGDIAYTYSAYRVSDTTGATADADGDYIRASPAAAAALGPVYIADGQSFYVSNGSSTQIYTWDADNVYSITTSNRGYVLDIAPLANNDYIGVFTVTSTGVSTSYYFVYPYDAQYYAPATITYGTNSINSLVLTDTIGDVALYSGSNYAFTANAGGDWLQIPSHILRDTTQTYKVLDGSYIYVGTSNSSSYYAQYTIDGSAISVTGMTLTFTHDTSITDATVYNMTATVTDTDLPGVCIEHEIQAVSYPSDVSKFWAGYNSAFYIDSSGGLYGIGGNDHGKFGIGTTTTQTSWVQLVSSGVADVISFSAVSYYLSTSGDVYFAGNTNGYADGSSSFSTDVTTWTQITALSDIVSLTGFSSNSTGTASLYAVNSSGALYVWGANYSGQLGIGSNSSSAIQKVVSSGVASVAVNNNNRTRVSPGTWYDTAYYVTTSGALYGTGSNYYSQLGDGTTVNQNSWTLLVSSGVEQVSYAYGSAIYLTTSGEIYGTGYNNKGQVGNGATSTVTSWTQTLSSGATEIYCSDIGSYYLDASDNLYTAGSYIYSGGTGYNHAWEQVATSVVDVSMANSGTFYIASDYTLWYTGNGNYGQHGNGNTNQYTVFTQVAANASEVEFAESTGGMISGYISQSGQLYMTGDNSYYQQADGTTTNVDTWHLSGVSSSTTLYTNPAETETVADQRGYIGTEFTSEIGNMTASGSSYAFSTDTTGDWLHIPSYVLKDGTGTYKVLSGSYIYVPDSTTTFSQYTVDGSTISVTGMTLTFTQDTSITDATVYDMTATVTDTNLPGVCIEYTISGTSTAALNVSEVVFSARSGYLVTTSGDLYVSGYNASGQLGLGTTTDVTTWTKAAADVVHVYPSVGTNYVTVYYIATNDDLYACGNNHYGQYGNGTTTSSTSWVKVGSNASKVICSGATSYAFSFMLSTSGVLYVAGEGRYGSTGSVTSSSWTQVATDVADVVNHNFSSYYLTNSNVLYATGWNSTGELGAGSTSYVTSWTQVATDVSKIYVGGKATDPEGYAFYISTSDVLYATGWNSFGQLGTGSTSNVTSWTQVATDVKSVTPGYISAFYINNSNELYGAGSDANGVFGNGSTAGTYITTWTQYATDAKSAYLYRGPVFVTATGTTTVGYSAYISTGDTLYFSGNYTYGQDGGAASGSSLTWQQSVSNVDKYFTYAAQSFYLSGTAGYVTGSNGLGSLGVGSTSNVTSWTQIQTANDITLYTNPTETVTEVGILSGGDGIGFVADASGDYLYVPIEDAVAYTYYVSYGSTVYAPDTNGTALGSHVVPDTSNIDSDVTITLTLQSGYNSQIYAVTATTTDNDIVGWAIPYTVTYEGTVDTHYAYNAIGNSSTYEFTSNASGDYLKVPYPMTVSNGFTYYVDTGDDIYYTDSTGLVAYTVTNTIANEGSTSYVAFSVAGRADVSDVMMTGGTTGNYIVVPKTYDTSSTNAESSYTVTYTPVRGTIANDAFTEDSSGSWVQYYTQNLENGTYYIGSGKTYYTDVSDTLTAYTAPNEPSSNFDLTFTANASHSTLYELTGETDGAGYTVIIPYTATYDTTGIVTHETVPLISLLPVVAAVMGVLSVVGLIYLRRGY